MPPLDRAVRGCRFIIGDPKVYHRQRAVQDHGELAGDGDLGFLRSDAVDEPGGPTLEWRGTADNGEEHVGGLEECTAWKPLRGHLVRAIERVFADQPDHA
jgi:hypothetical protein